jgi:uncharacterized cupin superfamily protein
MSQIAPTLPKLSNAATAVLEDTGPLKEATGHEMSTSALTIWKGDNGAETGIWECTPGPSRWDLEATRFCSKRAGAAPGRSPRRSERST